MTSLPRYASWDANAMVDKNALIRTDGHLSSLSSLSSNSAATQQQLTERIAHSQSMEHQVFCVKLGRGVHVTGIAHYHPYCILTRTTATGDDAETARLCIMLSDMEKIAALAPLTAASQPGNPDKSARMQTRPGRQECSVSSFV